MPDDGRPALPDIECIRGFAGSSPMAVAVLQGPAHRIRYVNPAFLAATGSTEDRLLDRRLAEAFPALSEGTMAALDRVHGTGEACRAEAIALAPRPNAPDAAPRLWDVEVSAVRGSGGAIAGVLVLLRDVTAREAQAARHRALVEAGSLAVWITGPDGALRENTGWNALTGQTDAQSAGLGWLDAIHPEDRDQVRGRWLASIRTGQTYEAEYRLCQPGGGWRWTAARAVPRRDPKGRILEWIGTNTDIEARRQAELGLLASESRFRTLAEAMPHLVWQTDAGGVPEYLNRRWRALTGLGLTALAGGGWMAALHADDLTRLEAAWTAALAAGGDYDADARISTATGGYRWHRVRAAPVRDARGRIRHWVGTCTDVEERHQAEERLREALAAREHLLREAEHRIKNSLQLVAGLLRLQSGRVAEPAAREALEAATARVQAVAEAHRALQMSPDLRSVRLADMLRELAAGASVQQPGADIRIEAPEELSLDAERAIPLALILSELVADALRHERPPGASHPVRLEAWVEAAGGLAVAVADGGIRLEEGSSAGRLGATVIRALAKQIDAELVTEGTPGSGTRVTLRLGLEAGQPAVA